jgi:hypothetical protein
MDRAPAPALRRLTAASLALVLVVIVASALIRLSDRQLENLLPAVRGVHRVSASAATLLIFAAAWLAWRAGRRALALSIVLLTIGLSVLGALTGISPPPLAQAGNLLGGLALAALLAWLLPSPEKPSSGSAIVLLLLSLQVALGAWLSIFAEELWSWPLLAHATLGLALAAALAWTRRLPLVLLGMAVAAAGMAAVLFGAPLAASLAHAVAVALLVAAAARLRGRFA